MEISFQYDPNRSDQSLLRLWKLTNNDAVLSKQFSSQRLNNRSWRLLNSKFLVTHTSSSVSPGQRLQDLEKDSLSDLPPHKSQFLVEHQVSSDRPSLFSHSSNLSLSSNKKSTNNSIESCSHNKPDGSESDHDSDSSALYDEEGEYDSDSSSNFSDISEEDEDEDEPNPNISSVSSLVRGFSPRATEFPQRAPTTMKKSSQSSLTIPKESQENTLPSKPSNSSPSLTNQSTSLSKPLQPNQSTSLSKPLQPNSALSRASQLSSSSLSSKHETPSNMPSLAHPSISRKDSLAVPQNNKNIFYIANSPSPPSDKKEKIQETSPGVKSSDGSNDSSRSRGIQRQDSLFSNFLMNFKKESEERVASKKVVLDPGDKDDDNYTSTDISEDDSDSVDDLSEDDDHKKTHHASLEKSSTPSSIHLEKALIEKTKENSRESATETNDNDSEWLSVSSEDDDQKDVNEDKFHPLQFNKIAPHMSSATSNSSTSTDILPLLSERSPDKLRNSVPAMSKPRSLLSGLFLNELAQQQNEDEGNSPFPSKPALKRSSTTGVITFAQRRNHLFQNTNSIQPKRPYIMLSKRYNSATDISKNYPHYQNNHVENDILPPNSDIVKRNIDDDNDSTILGKQKSIVGISDFNVTGSSSAVTKEPVSSITTSRSNSSSIHSQREHDKLSSSLNKLSGSTSQNSFRNLLSKSSINMSKIYKTSKYMLGRTDSSSSNIERVAGFADQHGQYSPSPGYSPSPIVTQPISHVPATSKLADSPKLGSIHSTSSPISACLRKSSFSTSAPKSSSGDFKSRSIKFSPKTTRRSMLSSELSESLKESIIIDYKLGKIPLPTKVIENNAVLLNKEGIVVDASNIDDDDFDDYHSKGW